MYCAYGIPLPPSLPPCLHRPVLDGIIKLFVVIDRHVRYAELEIVPRPVLERGPAFRPLVVDEEVGKQYAGRIGGDEDENVPEAVQVREVHPRPGVAEHAIVNPANDGHDQDGGIADAQPIHALILHATIGIGYSTSVCV